MESSEEAIGSNSSDGGEFINATVVVKGKRTKRQRVHPSAPAASAAAIADSSSASSVEVEASGSITEEEEDMANCLILLAQGHSSGADRPKPGGLREEAAGGGSATEKFNSRRFAEAATTTDGKAGYYVYECKTCNKCFPSFQALGGHRASHKKPKLAAAAAAAKADDQKLAMIEEDMLQISMNSFSKTMSINSKIVIKPKVHECSICGSEFSSGQALGGHMRRHRPLATPDPNKQEEGKKERSGLNLSLDLNLPAPSDDELRRPPSPDLALNIKQTIIFSASPASTSALVDCHY